MNVRPKGRSPRRPFHPERFEHGAPISGVDIRPIAIAFGILAILGLLWNVGHERTHTLLIDLPVGTAKKPVQPREAVTVHRIKVTANSLILFDDRPVNSGELIERLNRTKQMTSKPVIAFEADPSASYDLAVQVINAVRQQDLIDWAFCIDGLEAYRTFGKEREPAATSLIFHTVAVEPPYEFKPLPADPEFESCDPVALMPRPPRL